MPNYFLSATQVWSKSTNKALFTAALTLCFVPVVRAQVATTTQLTVSAPSVAVAVPTLLTATVSDAASHSVHAGTVTFYDGTRSLGSAQIVSGTSGAYPQGTANLKTASFTLGANSITAVFTGTKNDSASTSTAKTVTVTGLNPTTTTLKGFVTGTDFWLPATVHAFGTGTPTGSIDFEHISGGVPVGTIGTKSLSGAAWKTDLSISSTTAVSQDPIGIATGDFNGDGFLDLATANTGNSTSSDISVLLGNGDGTFKPQVTYPVSGGVAVSIYAADFNNDGKLDLAVANGTNGEADILLGNGDGTFQPLVEYSAVAGAQNFFIADFNRDGNLDIAVQGNDTSGHSVVLLLGNGDGTFHSQSLNSVGYGIYDVTGGDLNGDGNPDLIVTTPDGAKVLLGKGNGTFLPLTVYPALAGLYPTVGDVNGDGILDVVLTNGSDNTLRVSLGNGAGSFNTPQIYSLPITPYKPVVADINQDGKLDIVVDVNAAGYLVNNSMQLFPGNGDGTFQPAVAYFPATPVAPIVTGDFNGDGRPDLAETNNEQNTVNTILNGQTTSVLLAKQELGPGTTTVKAEWTGDGAFGDSISNAVKLTPNGTPPPNFPEGGEFDLSSLQLNGSAVAQSFPNDSFPYLTTGLPNQAGSVFYGAPQNVQAFTTDFWFEFFGVNTADGMTFTIQNDGPEALGSRGGGLGYKGISNSVAVKFDLYNNSGEGDNSTGLYVNGVAPTVPAVDLTPSGINLHNLRYVAAKEGDIFAVHVTYDGVKLSLTITDQDTQDTFSDSWPIDIPTVVGGTTAYVGFTGGTGGRVSAATILGWTYAPGTP